MLKPTVFFCLCLLFSPPSFAVEPSSSPLAPVNQDEAQFFGTVSETGGYLTPSLHQAFWQVMKSKYDEKQIAKIILETHQALDLLKEFQMQTWQSAKNSYFSKKIDKAKDYGRIKEQLLKLKSHYFAPHIIVGNAEQVIHGAASREPIDLGGGKFYVTPELIDENKVGIKGSYERLKLLLTPEWKGEYKEYILPQVSVSLLSLYSPDEYHEVVSHEDEKIDIHLAQLNTQENASYEIGAVDYQKEDKKFMNFTQEEKEIYVQTFMREQFLGYNITEPVVSNGSWRGYVCYKGVGTHENYNVILMSLFVNDRALYVKYVSDMPLSLASTNFNEFTKRIQILEKNQAIALQSK